MRNVPADLFRLVTDGDCAKELAVGTRFDRERETFPGWIKQQVVKLACASLVQTPFYLILDTDIFLANKASVKDLFRESDCTSYSAVCDPDKLVSFQAKNDMYPLANRSSHQLAWTQNSAHLLQLDVPLDWRIAMGVTPQIMATDIALGLANFIQERFKLPSWQAFLLESLTWHQIDYKASGMEWTPPWTEYTLYWIYASHACILDDYHTPAEVLQQNAVWGLDDFKAWNACKDTFNNGQAYFSLVQSRWQLDPDLIWKKIKPCLA
ncbi:hypothetical protein WJX72_010548 [[Myrmecia] bisecta]|uniref:Nucleotide-diphospho-sugar transferase n=1 Tax=[Myrmecia] bisecta TaxID=41462 RepID=A0AAW1PY43_9CHLO